MALYDNLSMAYDSSRKADPYIARRLFALACALPGQRYLDLGCGSGNYTLALKGLGLAMAGLDISRSMLSLASHKDPSVDWVQAAAETLPFKPKSFAGAFCVLALHHLADLPKVLAGCSRVVKETLVIFSATSEQMEYYWLHDYFPEAMRKSAEQMPSRLLIEQALHRSGFEEVFWEPYDVRDDLEDRFLYSGKNRPELYLDPLFRAGISTFSSLAGAEEIERSCHSLREDIRSGRISEVMQIYHGQGGDYMFVVARRGQAKD